MKSRIMIVLLGSALLSGCATFDKFHIWYYENFKDVPPVVVVDPIPVPNPKPDEKPVVAPGVDAFDYGKISWRGQANGSSASMTKTLRSAKLRGSQVYLDYDTIADWNPERHGDWDVDCYGRFCVFYEKDGKFIGGHSDHLKLNKKDRDLGNVFDGYLFQGSEIPPRDAKFYIMMLSNDKKNRTNIAVLER